jgi:hypothetical protein
VRGATRGWQVCAPREHETAETPRCGAAATRVEYAKAKAYEFGGLSAAFHLGLLCSGR